MVGYRTRLAKDLDRWIERGLVPADSRGPILDDARRAQGIDASAALAALGGLLLGAAVIAFVAANWSAIPRLPRFGLILGLFLAVSGGAAWAHARPMVRNIALLVAALVFAAAIGLTGQIFEIAGDPAAALRAAGLAAVLLAVAGRSSAAAMAAVALVGCGDFAGLDDRAFPWLVALAPAGLALAWAWRSTALAHAAALALAAAAGLVLGWLRIDHPFGPMLGVAAGFAALAAAARRLEREAIGPVVEGWAICAALLFLALAGMEGREIPLFVHRGLWLAAGAGVIALGLHDRRSATVGVGVAAFAAAVAAVLFDLGFGLLAASGVFTLTAVLALLAGAVLRRRRAA